MSASTGLQDGSIPRRSRCSSTGRSRCSKTSVSAGSTLYLASGTDEPFVKREAELLGLYVVFRPAHLWRPG